MTLDVSLVRQKYHFFVDADDALVPQGIISYWDLKDVLAKYPDFRTYSWNCPAAQGVTVPHKHVYSSQRKAFASLDDEEVTSKKVQWAKAVGLGGFFFWDAQQDKNGLLLAAARQAWGKYEKKCTC